MVLWDVWALGRRYGIMRGKRGAAQRSRAVCRGEGQNGWEGRALFWGAGTVWGCTVWGRRQGVHRTGHKGILGFWNSFFCLPLFPPFPTVTSIKGPSDGVKYFLSSFLIKHAYIFLRRFPCTLSPEDFQCKFFPSLHAPVHPHDDVVFAMFDMHQGTAEPVPLPFWVSLYK